VVINTVPYLEFIRLTYLLRKWNYETHEYERFISPAENLTVYTEDMDEPVDCANCGYHMLYGETYTSRTIHNEHGIGFPVCEECHRKEMENENG
jgi:Zn ribbon nucleic-acid-binding protein